MAVQAWAGGPLTEVAGEREFSGRLIVRPKQAFVGMSAPQAVMADLDARYRISSEALRYSPEVDEYVVDVPAGMTDVEYAKQLAETGDYEYVQPDWIVYVAATPDDPRFPDQWHHGKLQSELAWDIDTGVGVTVAIVDTGVDSDHPDLASALVPGFSYFQAGGGYQAETYVGQYTEDNHGHGTHVAGCAAAVGNNGVGVSGVGWNLTVRPVKISENGSASLSDITLAARQAAYEGAEIVNVSFSGVDQPTVGTAGSYCKNQGSSLFWAAGNESTHITGVDHDDVIVVGSVTSSDTRASSSNWGDIIDVSSPGVGIWSTTRGGGYGSWSGTSMACPVAAGVGAVIRSLDPSLTPDEVEQVLFAACDDIGAVGEDEVYGHGRVNLFNALQAMTAPTLYVLTVESEGLAQRRIYVSPADYYGEDDEYTNFTRTYEEGAVVTLTAPAEQEFGGATYLLTRWMDDGAPQPIGDNVLVHAVDADATLVVSYNPLGDLNCDGTVTSRDIDAFVTALTDQAGYETAYPDCNFDLADVNGDDSVNSRDIDAFVALLVG